MRFYDINFFCDEPREDEKSAAPKVSVVYDGEECPWPITIRINSSGIHHKTPNIFFHIQESHWAEFVDSVKEADRQLTPKILGREHYE